MSKQMFTPEEHAARLPGWKKWAAEHGVCVPPAFLYNYVPTAAINHADDAVTAARERCAKIAASGNEERARFEVLREYPTRRAITILVWNEYDEKRVMCLKRNLEGTEPSE